MVDYVPVVDEILSIVKIMIENEVEYDVYAQIAPRLNKIAEMFGPEALRYMTDSLKYDLVSRGIIDDDYNILDEDLAEAMREFDKEKGADV